MAEMTECRVLKCRVVEVQKGREIGYLSRYGDGISSYFGIYLGVVE